MLCCLMVQRLRDNVSSVVTILLDDGLHDGLPTESIHGVGTLSVRFSRKNDAIYSILACSCRHCYAFSNLELVL